MKINSIKILFFISVCILFFSCSKRIGYSTLLWSIPEKNLYAGDVVEVFIKSNISKVYVVGVPNTKEKIEVPLWQLMPPVSKAKALKLYSPMNEYRNIYAKVALDGLPVRFEPVNTSRQVYRLKKGEEVKILYKGKGVQVMSGNKPITGDWLRVLTQDGTQGWCFSYNLRLFNEKEGEIAAEVVIQEDDTLTELLQNNWYPENFASMINSGTIDLSILNPKITFEPKTDDEKTIFNMFDVSETYPFAGVTKTSENVYHFTNTPLTVTIRRNNFIVVQYIDSKGQPKAYNLVTIQDSIDDAVKAEKERRTALLERISTFSKEFTSANYGNLQINTDGTFLWYGYQQLVPSIISNRAQNKGTVEMRLFLDSVLSTWYDGVISFKFDGTQNYVNFLYKLEDNGLRLEDATNVSMRNNIVTGKNNNALVLFFAQKR